MAKKIIIVVLLLVGLVAVCGEPSEDFVSTFFVQLIVFASSWGTAFLLAKKWNIH